MTSEIKKEIKHPLPVKSPFTHFNQEEKDRLSMMIRKEISIVERDRYNHSMIVDINKTKPVLEDSTKQDERNRLIEQHKRVIEMFTKDLEQLENIQKQLLNE